MKRLLSVVVGLGLWAAVSHAAVPEKLSIQGVLEDGSGQILTEEPTSLTFRIYDAATSGTLLWTEVHNSGNFTFDKGVFSAVLGEITALSGVSFADPRWISIQVESNAEQTPRIELTASAYSLMAKTVSDDAITSAKIADGAVSAADLASGAVVTSVNGLSDAVGLEGDGSIISVSSTGQTITISSAGVSGASSVSADDDAVITADGDDDGTGFVVVKSGADTTMVIANDGKIGIGTTDPDGTLHAMTASGGTITPHTSADDFIVENSGDTGVSVFSGSSAAGYLAFGSSTNNWGGVMRYTHNNNQLYFHTDAGTNYMVFDDGNVGIGTPTPGADLDIVTTTSDPDIHLKEDSNHFGSLFWSRSGDYLGFHTNTSAGGNTRMVIAGDGKVGIGKVPDTFLLDIEASSAGSGIMRLKATNSSHYSGVTLLNDSVTWNLAVAGSAVGGTGNKFYIHDGSDYLTTWDGVNNRVGIGTISPDGVMHIASSGGSSEANGVVLEGTGDNNVRIRWKDNWSVDSGATRAEIYGDAYSSANNGALRFKTLTSGSLTEKMIIDNNGNVGIGQTSPGTFYSGASSNSVLAVGSTSESNGSGLWLVSGTSSVPGLYFTDTDNTTNQSYIQYNHATSEMYFGANSSLRMTIDSSGNLVPGANNSYSLGTTSKEWSVVYANNGTIQSSDRRLKKDIRGLDYGLETVMAMRPVSYRWKANPEQGLKVGLIAQEVQELVEEVVHVGDDEKQTMGVNYAELVPVLIKAIQDQQALIEREQALRVNLESTLRQTQRQLVQLNAQMAQVQKQIAAQTTSNATLANAK